MTDPSYSLAHVMPAQAPRKRRGWLIPTAVAAVVAVLFGGLALFLVFRGSGFDVTGTLTLTDDKAIWSLGMDCQGSRGFDDIREGAQVIVTDADGKTVAVSRLGRGTASTSTSCVFPVEIKGVPGGSDFYGITVSHRRGLTYSADEIRQPLQLTLG